MPCMGRMLVQNDLLKYTSVKAMLPPGHAIVAEMVYSSLITEFLIEGPLMPDVPRSGRPEPVEMLFEVRDGVRMARWAHLPSVAWSV